MISRSHTNLVALGTGNFEGMDAGGGGSGVSGGDDEGERKRQRRRTLGMDITEIDDDEDGMSSDAQERIIIVANQLPLHAIRDTADSGWVFSWDEESLLLHLKEGLPVGKEVIYVGSLPVRVNPADEDVVSQSLLDRFNCVPAFLPVDLKRLFYHQFCKKYLWPLFHYAIPLTAHHGGFFDRSHWEAYVRANKIFSDKVLEVLTSDRDYVWIHDYHLMVLPKFLRHRFYRLRIGFFFHSPFPSSEIFRTLPVREELIKGLLNCDLIGFHTYDYARHFLSVCLRLMGLEHHLRRGYIGLDYHGRTIGIKISPVGINLQQFKDVIGSPEMQSTLAKLKEKFAGKVVLLGVDDLDPFKGINLKLLAFKKMLEMNSSMKGNPVLVQIVKPARSEGKEIEETQKEILEIYKRINSVFGTVFYRPVVYIDSPVSLAERIAYYTLADCLVVTSVRDGMNLTPYEYLVCRQEASGYDSGCPKTSMLVVSEFVGCSLSLSGAIRTNPWNVISTGEAMQRALEATETEKQMWHDKHYKYVCEHDVGYWSRGFFQDLQRSCEDHFNKRFLSLGVGFGFRVMALDPEFTKLKPPEVLVDYSNAERRVIFLDYDGTLMPQKHIHEQPSEEIISMLNSLTASDRNVVYIVSGRGRVQLSNWFQPCKKLGIAAEHGYFIRSSADEDWEQSCQKSYVGWMQTAEQLLKYYTEAIVGSHIETKETALVWHHQAADLDSCCSDQVTEVLDHLESVLANEPVAVKRGKLIVEINPQGGVSKGLVVERILERMCDRWGQAADFVLCVGDDCSDEDMFDSISSVVKDGRLVTDEAKVFSCTVGQKPSKARYYLDDPSQVLHLLACLAAGPADAFDTNPVQ